MRQIHTTNNSPSASSTPHSNRHAADALADVRSEIKQLQKREEELRDELLQHGANRVGDDWEATVRHCEIERLDTAAVIKHFGKAVLRQFFTDIAFDAVYLKKRHNI